MKSHKTNLHKKVIVTNKTIMGLLLVAFSITLLSIFIGALRLGNFGYFTGAATSFLGERDIMISQNEEMLSVKNGFDYPIKVILYLDSDVSSECLNHLWIASQDKSGEEDSCLSGLTENYIPLENYDADNGLVVCDYLNSDDQNDEMNVFFKADSSGGLENNCQIGISLVAESLE